VGKKGYSLGEKDREKRRGEKKLWLLTRERRAQGFGHRRAAAGEEDR
jgi:hypothetical protein